MTLISSKMIMFALIVALCIWVMVHVFPWWDLVQADVKLMETLKDFQWHFMHQILTAIYSLQLNMVNGVWLRRVVTKWHNACYFPKAHLYQQYSWWLKFAHVLWQDDSSRLEPVCWHMQKIMTIARLTTWMILTNNCNISIPFFVNNNMEEWWRVLKENKDQTIWKRH